MAYYDLRFELAEELDGETTIELSDEGYFLDTIDGVPHISIAIDSNSTPGRQALFEAHRALKRISLKVVRAVPNLVTLPGAASRFDTSRQAAQRWKADSTFPKPVITDGASLWYWPDVRAWVEDNRNRKSYDDCLYPSYDDYAIFNGHLALEGAMPTVPDLHHGIADALARMQPKLSSPFLDVFTNTGIWKGKAGPYSPHSPTRFVFHGNLHDDGERSVDNGADHRV